MARSVRLDVPGYPQHIIQRGNNRNVCFFRDSDYLAYKEFLGLALEKSGCSLHAYVLMRNHVHLLVTGHFKGSAAILMQSLGRRYVRYINRNRKRTGTLWEGRYKSSLIETDRYLLTCYRYIEMNPVRAAMVTRPEHYLQSSHLHHINIRFDPLIDDHSLFRSLGQSAHERAYRYRKMFERHLDEKAVSQIRSNTNRGRVLGSETFSREIREAMRHHEAKPGSE